ncbi:DUF4174 domain-containing protein [uncultured Paracoccus sp.]|uniref:DUF4174 domain-containing protein n=1 Tax=uncultured Paracoccus sp. TaxID=189685 RepID=UPI002634CC7B|nr:DUF4174 domain-containing protein [uncultured Paracoccus sp.]
MNLRPVLMVMLLAAMGPGKSGALPEAAEVAPEAQPEAQPEPAPEVVAEPVAPELVIMDAAQATPEEFLWQRRPVVVFADTPQDPAFVEQMNAITARAALLAERDVVVITDTAPDARTVWRNTLHPRGFSLVLMDKDGQVKLRKPLPWSGREIGRAIDKFPLRRQEIGRAGVLP